jgi:ABC-type siderophore export system fused ATPase/permease subunit
MMILQLYLFRGSRRAAVTSICFGLLSGGAGALLTALINYALGRVNSATTVLVCRQTTSQVLRRQTTAGLSVFAGAGKWENALFLICIAPSIFALPAFKTVEPQELTGYTPAILYLMAPLEAILNYLPALGGDQAAMNKIESLGMSLAAQPDESPSRSNIQLLVLRQSEEKQA